MGSVLSTESELSKALGEFYSNEVEISNNDMITAQAVVERIHRALKPKLSSIFLDKYGVGLNDWMHTGSVYEGLKVIAPDEFDIMVEINIPGESFLSRLFGSLFGGYETPTIYKFIDASGTEAPFSSLIGGKNVINSQMVMQRFQGALQRAVNSINIPNMKIWTGVDGPAVKVMVDYSDCYGCTKYLKIDLVPAIQEHGRYFVAKPDKYDSSYGADAKWRSSYSNLEKRIVNGASSQSILVLKLIKAFCKKNAPMACIDSYYLKTIFLHMLKKYGSSWSDTEHCFVLFLEEILHYFKAGKLPHYFVAEYNLLEHFVVASRPTVNNLVRHIEKLIASPSGDGIITILQRG